MYNTQAFPVRIVYQKMHTSQALEEYIRTQAYKLNRYFNHILNCQVLVKIMNPHANQGKLFQVCADLKVPKATLVVSSHSSCAKNHAHEDVFVTIRDAFAALKRKLQAYVCKLHGKVKRHLVAPHGRVAQITTQGDHGFIESSDGRSVYFTKNSVVDGSFDRLEQGSEVRFVEAPSASGGRLSASTVKLIKKHHIVGME